MRNKLFTAFTRAKGWLKISGIDIENTALWNEINQIKKDNFIMKFKQSETYTIQRDREKQKANQKTLKNQIEKMLKNGTSCEEIENILRDFREETND